MSLFDKLAHQIPAKAGDASSQSGSVSVARATDLDEFLESVRGYQLGMMQIDRGPFVAELVQTQVGGVLLTAALEPPAGTITFAVRTSATPALWQGADFGPQHLILARPGIELDMVSHPGYRVATASFPLELVREAADRPGWMTTVPTSLLIGLEHNTAEFVRGTFDALFNEAVARPHGERAAAWALSKHEDLLRALLQCLSESPGSTEPASSGERARVLKAALAAIKDRPEDVLTVGDLCSIARASERTLHYAFVERFSLAPAHYMKAYRLNAARDDLCREHEPSMKIADVANKWGFWHLGQFAKDYRNWFGELPSDTYARKRGTSPRRSG